MSKVYTIGYIFSQRSICKSGQIRSKSWIQSNFLQVSWKNWANFQYFINLPNLAEFPSSLLNLHNLSISIEKLIVQNRRSEIA